MSRQPRLYFGNTSFERQLDESCGELPQQLRRLEAELACMWLAIAQPGDVVYCPLAMPDDFWQQHAYEGQVQCWDGHSPLKSQRGVLALMPWGWSTLARRQAAKWRSSVIAPPVDVVRCCNSREFSAQMELELNCQLCGSACLCSMGDLEAAIGSYGSQQRWVIKANLGYAGRERVLGVGSAPDAVVTRWVQRRFSQKQTLYFEPWVERLAEVGVQWEVPQQGPPQLVGLAELISSERGEYRGSRIAEGLELLWSDVLDSQRLAISEMQHRGYFGPVGIDAMRYRDSEGVVRVRPLQDINARLTMGRIALGWADRFRSSGSWLHASQCSDPSAVPTSPESLGGLPVLHRTWWVPES